MHQAEEGLLEIGEDKGSDSELCPRALKQVLLIGCHGDNFFLSDILCDTAHDFHHEHVC